MSQKAPGKWYEHAALMIFTQLCAYFTLGFFCMLLKQVCVANDSYILVNIATVISGC